MRFYRYGFNGKDSDSEILGIAFGLRNMYVGKNNPHFSPALGVTEIALNKGKPILYKQNAIQIGENFQFKWHNKSGEENYPSQSNGTNVFKYAKQNGLF